MKKATIMIGLLMTLLIFQGVAEAASISTRVRILESKTYKLGKEIRQQKSLNAAQSEQLDKGLQEIHRLKRKVEKFMTESDKKQKMQTEEDPRNSYSYP